MSLSKGVNRRKCEKCLCMLRSVHSTTNAGHRQIYERSQGSNNRDDKMTANWKIVSHLKDQIADNYVMSSLRREWANLIKRLPAISQKSQSKEVSTEPTPGELSRVGQLFESIQVINDLRAKLQTSAVVAKTNIAENKWKHRPKSISPESIVSRTNYLISALQSAHSDESIIKRIEDLLAHFLEYPDAAVLAVKYGVVKVLLKVRLNAKSDKVHEAAQLALGMVGFADPPAAKGIRILSIDGGGVRGLLVITLLRRLEELTGKKVHELFDYICGVSTGSILATTIGASGKSLDEIAELYKIMSTKIFAQGAFEGVRSLFWNHGYYDSAMWEAILQEHIGSATFYESARKSWCPKIGAVSTIVTEGQIVPFIFRNYEHPYRVRSQYVGSNRHKLWEAARASAAAPAYFGEFRVGAHLHQDGGMLVNNPAAVALHEAKLLWPKHDIQCLVSCGTGRVAVTSNKDPVSTNSQTSWKDKFTQVLISATDTEAVHTILSDLLPSTRYFRFNPYLTEMLSMVEYRPEKLAQLEQDGTMYIRRNDEKFSEAAALLSAPKPLLDKCAEWVKLRMLMYQPF